MTTVPDPTTTDATATAERAIGGQGRGARVPDLLQRHALQHLHTVLRDGGRGVVALPCGGGKTLLGRWFAEQLRARLTVVFVPSLALVPQTVLAYRDGAAWPHRTMIVCSDPSSGRAVAVDDLDLPAWARVEVAASTSPRAIGAFLAPGGAGAGTARVIVSTYHSAPRVATALHHAGITADLMVCDEAHRLAGRPRREFRAVLDDTGVPARRRVFLTATPVEAAAWAAEADTPDSDAPLGLDDQTLFGPTIYGASFGQAVAAGRLVDYDVQVLAAPAGAGLHDGPDVTVAVLAAIGDGARRILTFHSRVRHARALAAALHGRRLSDGRIVRAEHLEARHRAEHRRATLARLAEPEPGEVVVVASARVLSEGIDVPGVDTVVFAEPRTSPVDIVQAVGRAMRVAPGKTRGRVVLAVTTTDADGSGLDEDTELGLSRWRHVWTVLRALAAMDDRFAARLRQRLTPGSPGGAHGSPGPGLQLSLPAGFDLERVALRCLDRTGGAWWTRYELLAAHARQQHGAARPSPDIRRGGVNLHAWVARQRTLHRHGQLEPDRVAALQRLPGWAWDAREMAWWAAAAIWTRRHPTRVLGETRRWEALTDTPARAGDGPGRGYATLAEFAVDTCVRRRRGQLPAHLEAAAAALPGWTWTCVPDDDAAMVDALAGYGEWEKTLNPPHDYRDEYGRQLGAWLTAVRRRHYTGRLHPALEIELQMLGREHYQWRPLRWEAAATGWRLSYLALRQFVDREHTTRIPTDHTEALPDCTINISRWCVVQRLAQRHGRLEAGRVAALQQIPGWRWEIPVRAGERVVLDDVEHGHRWAYARGCRCDPCTDANSAEARRLVAEGTDLVDARPAREHLRRLLARGAGQKPLARAAGVNVKSIVAIAAGEVSRIRPERAQLILALTHDAADEHTGAGRWGELVDARATWRIIDWMVLRGWPKAWISREIGQDGRALQLRRDRISRANADKIAELDRRLGRSRRPPTRKSSRISAGPNLPTLDEILAAEQVSSTGFDGGWVVTRRRAAGRSW
jgi:superfamily II DNA or RNA helicase